MSPNAKQSEREAMQDTTTQGESAEDAVQATQESLDQVRNILFGSQIREQDRRFAQLQEQVAGQLSAHREETAKSLASLETFVKTEFGALAQRITNESQQQRQATQRLSDEMHSGIQGIESRITTLDQQQAAADTQLRAQLLEQSQTLRAETKRVHDELQTLVEKVVKDLSGAKTDRAALANLFTEMAGKLQG